VIFFVTMDEVDDRVKIAATIAVGLGLILFAARWQRGHGKRAG
jgi:hypothetical protein